MYQKGRAWIELDIDNLAYNIRQFRKYFLLSVRLCPPLKQMPMDMVLSSLQKHCRIWKLKIFCVASVNEAVELRKAGDFRADFDFGIYLAKSVF